MPPKIASIVDSLPSENRRVSATWLPVLVTWVLLCTQHAQTAPKKRDRFEVVAWA